ncbi:MAG TPA: NADH-quinone oxidoreductase subunit M [Dehalococcoidia bacterium]|nr:NADH-quinone oxidoreductase subunit M [Dehalococcoidia bacterium]
MEQGHALLALIAIPLLTAAVLVLVPSQRKDLVRLLSVASGLALFIISLYVFIDYSADGSEQFTFLLRYDWLENVGILGDNGITLYLGLDGIAAVMILLNGVVTFAGTLISWKIEHKNKDFFVLFFILTAGVFGTFSSLDLFFFFFFYEIAVLPMYLLIAVWGSSTQFPTFYRTKEYSAMKLMLMLVGASVLLFFAIFATFTEAGLGTFSLPDLYAHAQAGGFDENFQKWAFPLFAIGAGCLAGLWPFHTWSPDGHVAAPTAVSMLHAGVLMKLGAFGILRLGIQMFPEGAEFWMPALIVLAIINVLYGAVSAMGQTDFKYVIGYSSVSHMGLVIVGLATLDPVGINGAALQMFSHGVMTALMFAMVGAVYDQAHTREIALFGGLASKMPRFAIFFLIAGVTSVGLPGSSGFIAEFNIFVGLFRDYPVIGALGILGAGITAIYIFRLLALAFFGQFDEQRWGGLKEMSRFEFAGGGLLVVFILFMGLWPAAFVDKIAPSVLDILQVAG